MYVYIDVCVLVGGAAAAFVSRPTEIEKANGGGGDQPSECVGGRLE